MNKKEFKGSINNKFTVFAAIVMILAIAIVGLVNFILGTLDDKIDLNVDFTAFRLYSITSRTKSVLDTLDKDIYIYTTDTAGLEDKNVNALIKSYSNYSDYLHVTNIDIITNPAAIEHYNSNSDFSVITSNVIISNSADPMDTSQTFRVLDSYDFYTIDTETNQYENFSAEEAITNAISYVLSPNEQKVWILNNHTSDASIQYEIYTLMEEYNFDVANLNLLNGEAELMPGDIVLIIAPDSDLTDNELNQLKAFDDNGGRMLIAIAADNYNSNDMTNLSSLYEQYNIKYKSGTVIETDSKNTAVSVSNDYSSVFIIPQFAEHEITDRFILGNYKVLLGINAGALSVPNKVNDASINIETVIQTSSTSYLEPWTSNMDLEPAENDEYGPFAQAVSVIKENGDDALESKMLIVSAPNMLISARSYSENVYKNYELFHQMVRWLSVSYEDVYIADKPLSDNPLMIGSMNTAYFIIALVCVVIPLIIFAMGIYIYKRRKNL